LEAVGYAIPAVLVTLAVRGAACAVDFANCCASDVFIKLKMHQTFCLDPVGGAYDAPQNP